LVILTTTHLVLAIFAVILISLNQPVEVSRRDKAQTAWKHSNQCIHWQPTQQSSNLRTTKQANIKLCFVYTRGGQPVRDQEPHFLLYYRKEPHGTHVHHLISSSLTHIPFPS